MYLADGEGVNDGDSCLWEEHKRMKPHNWPECESMLRVVAQRGLFILLLHGAGRARTYGRIEPRLCPQLLSSTMFSLV